MKFSIKKKNYEIKFGFAAMRILCKRLGFQKLTDLDKHIVGLGFTDDEPTLDQFDFIGELIVSGLEAANKNVDFDVDDVLQELFENPKKTNEVIAFYTASMPKANPVNPEGRGK